MCKAYIGDVYRVEKKIGSSDSFLGGGGEHFSGELSLYCVEYLRRGKFWVKNVNVEKITIIKNGKDLSSRKTRFTDTCHLHL